MYTKRYLQLIPGTIPGILVSPSCFKSKGIYLFLIVLLFFKCLSIANVTGTKHTKKSTLKLTATT